MTHQAQIRSPGENEKVTPCMVYLPMKLVWGQLLSKKGIRVETWLKMSMVPDYLTILDAQMLVFGGANPARLTFPEIYVPLPEILAYHLLPPATQNIELDYDPNEPNRKMEPVSVLSSIFRFTGHKRISTFGDFITAISAGKETFTPLYDAVVSHPTVTTMKSMQVPYLLLRQEAAAFMKKGS